MIVMKFGGTSVEDASAMRRVLQISRAPLVVVSACSGVTNELIGAAQMAKGGDEQGALSTLERIRKRHLLLIDSLVGAPKRAPAVSGVEEMFSDLRDLV